MFELVTENRLELALTGLFLASAAMAGVVGISMRHLPPREITDDSWRDEMPWLRLAKPLLQRFAPLTDARMSVPARERLSTRLQSAGMVYAITPAELVVLRWVATVGAIVVTMFLAARYELWDTSYVVLLAGLVPLGYFYVDLWLVVSTIFRTFVFGTVALIGCYAETRVSA